MYFGNRYKEQFIKKMIIHKMIRKKGIDPDQRDQHKKSNMFLDEIKTIMTNRKIKINNLDFRNTTINIKN